MNINNALGPTAFNKKLEKKLLEILACPIDKSYPLELISEKTKDNSIIEGSLKCSKCHMIFPIARGIPSLFPTDVENKTDHQTAAFLTTQEGNTIGNYGINELVESYQPGMRVLDLGAGNNKINLDGLIKFDMFEYLGINIIGNSETLPFPDETFDLVLSLAVLEHVSDPHKMAEEIFRITKKSGRIFILTAFIQWEHAYPYHYFNFSQHGLRQVFKKFREIHCGPSKYTSLSQLVQIIVELNKHIQDPNVDHFVNEIMKKEKQIMNTDSYNIIYPSVHYFGEKPRV